MKRCIAILWALLLIPAMLAAQPDQSGTLREAEIRSAVETYVRQKVACTDCDVRVRRLTFSGSTAMPDGPLEYEVVAPQQWEGWGNVSIAVIARKGDRVVRNIPARLEVEALADMVVAVRQIDHGTIITAADVVLKKMDISALQGKQLTATGDVIGRKARSTLRPNMPIKADQLEKVALIKSGQLVTILAETGSIRITVTGKAKSAGAAGDTITVQNLDSQKEFPARIIDARTVSIVF